MKLLDLFCGAGGCSMGYARAGFTCTGIDINPHPDYPFEFLLDDALCIDFRDYDVVHASPPCQLFSVSASGDGGGHPDYVEPIRERLRAWGGPYVIENVVGCPLIDPIMLCGTEFNLQAKCEDGIVRQLRRHRLFESNVALQNNGGCKHSGRAISVVGHSGGVKATRSGEYQATKATAKIAMGIDWMLHEDITQAIPPAYTEHIGRQIMEYLA
jgi:DNA (cytosine-5)-methyltransferase 1